MKKGGGKQKGSAFEREICRLLSIWLTEGKDDRIAWRSSSSGGTATIRNRKGSSKFGQTQSGDIVKISDAGEYPNADWFFNHFTIEAKCYKEISFYPPFNKTLLSFFEQANRQSVESGGKVPILLMKANNRKILFFVKGLPGPEKSLALYDENGEYWGCYVWDTISFDAFRLAITLYT